MTLSCAFRCVAILASGLLCFACSKSETSGPPQGCSFSTPYGCWACDGSLFGRDYKIGCRRKNDCAIFCGALPDGFDECHSEMEGVCTTQPLPYGTFEVCAVWGYRRLLDADYTEPAEEHPPAYLPMASCGFCSLSSLATVSLASAPDGDCYFLSCLPTDVDYPVSVESCPNLTPIGDGGIPDVASPWDMGVPPDLGDPSTWDGAAKPDGAL